MAVMRIAKYLARQGYDSRRGIEKMIDARQISVNGEVIADKGRKVDPDADEILVKGVKVEAQGEFYYWLLNKPEGILSAAKDSSRRITVIDLLRKSASFGNVFSRDQGQFYPVGRLDQDSRGLILLTNDGELTHLLTHPKFHVPKTYRVCVTGELNDKKLERLRTGVYLREGMTAPASVKVVKRMRLRNWLELVIHEGRYRQVRRMCSQVHLEVIDLVRVGFGSLRLGNLPEGDVRMLAHDEVKALYSEAERQIRG